MEKIILSNQQELEIKGISECLPLLFIEFPDVTDLSTVDLSVIELLTDGGVSCRTLEGYTTIYRIDGNIVILSNDGSVYRPIVESESIPFEPYVPTARDLEKQEIATLKAELEATDYKVIKCMEYQLASAELPYDIVVLHADRKALRDKINELELNLTTL